MLNERHGERVKIEINVFLSKTRFISGWKSLTKRGRSISANGWKWWRAVMVSADGANARTAQAYSLHEQVFVHDAIVLMEVE